MKKALTLVLVLALLMGCAVAATAEDWNPGRPYHSLPEIDTTQQLGYMLFYPNQEVDAEGLCDRLNIYLPREDLAAGEGQLILLTADATEVWRTPMNDERFVLLRKLTETELASLQWQGGMCFEIKLPRSLSLGTSYVVNMEAGCIVAGELTNVQIGGADAWAFDVVGDYGLNAVEYRRPSENGNAAEMIDAPQAGDEIHFGLLLGGEAVAASLYSNDGSVDFEISYFTESAEVVGIVVGETPSWGVLFLDAEGNIVNRADF